MNSMEANRRFALAFGVIVPSLQFCRVLLWGYWPPLRQLPVDIDGYVAGALLLSGVAMVSRKHAGGPALLAGGWGFICGIDYRSFFEQLADPARHAGHEVLVMAVKGVVLALAALGLFGAVRAVQLEAKRGE